MSFERRLAFSLFGLRLGVSIVMFMWTIDKFVNPEHTAGIFDKFYDIPGLTNWMSYTIGGIQALILLAFVIGFQKRWSYGLVFIMHFISTVSSYQRYLDPWTAPNLLFYAAIPMLAAIATLYIMRDQDTFLTLESSRSSSHLN